MLKLRVCHRKIHRLTFCYTRSMTSRRQQARFLQPIQSIWCVACVCFLLMSVFIPVHSGHTMPIDGLDGVAQSSSHTMHAMSSGAVHDNVIAHHQQDANDAESPCEHPDCHDKSDCADNCMMNTCCHSPSVSNTSLIRLRFGQQNGDTLYRNFNSASAITNRVQPRFRPPIQ